MDFEDAKRLWKKKYDPPREEKNIDNAELHISKPISGGVLKKSHRIIGPGGKNLPEDWRNRRIGNV